MFASTYSNMIIAALPDAETAGAIATLMFSLILTFNGVFQPPEALPGFWIFMYRVSPLTYLGKLATLPTSVSSKVETNSLQSPALSPPASVDAQ